MCALALGYGLGLGLGPWSEFRGKWVCRVGRGPQGENSATVLPLGLAYHHIHRVHSCINSRIPCTSLGTRQTQITSATQVWVRMWLTATSTSQRTCRDRGECALCCVGCDIIDDHTCIGVAQCSLHPPVIRAHESRPFAQVNPSSAPYKG